MTASALESLGFLISARMADAISGKQGEEVIRFEGHTRNMNAVAHAPDGRHAVSGSSYRTVRAWNVPD